MTAKPAAPAKAPREALLLEIAAKHFFLETLETRNSDRLDFHDVAVWSIRAALEAAFAAGRAANRRTGEHAMTTRRATTDNAAALNAFLAAKIEIDAMLERLNTLSHDHFETHPDEINWSDVGTLNHCASLLRQITDSAFKEGEHAA